MDLTAVKNGTANAKLAAQDAADRLSDVESTPASNREIAVLHELTAALISAVTELAGAVDTFADAVIASAAAPAAAPTTAPTDTTTTTTP